MKVPNIFIPEKKERLEEKTKDYVNRVEPAQNPYDEEELGIGAADTPPKFKDLTPEELEKKLLEDYTTLP